jgi:mRNA interferase RelE/StbE
VASYSVRIKASAAKELEAIGSNKDRQRVAQAIQGLAHDPRPIGCVKLSGRTNLYRIRSGDYRVLYSIEDEILVILVIKIGHRRDVYR